MRTAQIGPDLRLHKPYRVLEIPIKSGNSHLDVEFCDSCDEEDTASVLAWVNNANVKSDYRVNFFKKREKRKQLID